MKKVISCALLVVLCLWLHVATATGTNNAELILNEAKSNLEKRFASMREAFLIGDDSFKKTSAFLNSLVKKPNDYAIATLGMLVEYMKFEVSLYVIWNHTMSKLINLFANGLASRRLSRLIKFIEEEPQITTAALEQVATWRTLRSIRHFNNDQLWRINQYMNKYALNYQQNRFVSCKRPEVAKSIHLLKELSQNFVERYRNTIILKELHAKNTLKYVCEWLGQLGKDCREYLNDCNDLLDELMGSPDVKAFSIYIEDRPLIDRAGIQRLAIKIVPKEIALRTLQFDHQFNVTTSINVASIRESFAPGDFNSTAAFANVKFDDAKY